MGLDLDVLFGVRVLSPFPRPLSKLIFCLIIMQQEHYHEDGHGYGLAHGHTVDLDTDMVMNIDLDTGSDIHEFNPISENRYLA